MLVTGLEGMSCEERVRTHELSRLEERKLRGDLIAFCNSLRRGNGEESGSLFSLVNCNRARGNGAKLHQWMCRQDIRKNFCTVRVVKCWNRLPSEVIDAQCLLVIKETFREYS